MMPSLLQYIVGVSLLWCLAVTTAGDVFAAVYYVESFTDDSAGWEDRDAGKMLVAYSSDTGNGPGSLSGYFEAQDVSLPEIDAFRISTTSSAGSFTGDYWADLPSFSSWSFSFYAVDVLPSFLMVSFDAGGTLFNRLVTTQVGGIGQWYTVTVPLSYDVNWFGGSAAAFSGGLSNVGYIDIQLSRSGSDEQTYRLDNFGVSGFGEGDSAVPEPTTLALVALAAVIGWSAFRCHCVQSEESG